MKILTYDIETVPYLAYVWRLGKQVVRHHQLKEGHDIPRIICVAYCWNDGKPARVIGWDFDAQDDTRLIEQFDEVIEQADVTLGKNSDRFDVKHINTQRMLAGLPGMPDWAARTEDLEKQLRKHFMLPSYGLDYISKILGYGGKTKMEFQDWIDIVEKRNILKYNKMLKYCKKDVEDTRAVWEHCEKHFTPKWNLATAAGELVCIQCGSADLYKKGEVIRGKSLYKRFYCKTHEGAAGYAPILKGGKLGKMGR